MGISLEPVRELLEVAKLSGRHSPSTQQVREAVQLVNYNVKVTNIGNMDADDVLLGFLVPPSAGLDGVPLQTLFGFERVHVKAGQSVTVNIYPSLTDFTNTMVDGTRT